MRSHMRTSTAVLAALVVLTAGGCFRPKDEVYSELRRSRMRAYSRWRNAAKKDPDLPRLEGELSLSDAVRAGLAFNKDLRLVVQEKARAEGRFVEARSEALPAVDLSAGYTRLDQVMTIDLGADSFQVGDQDNWFYRVDVVQPLFKGGSIPAAIRGAQLFRYISDEKVRGGVQDVVLAVASAYYDVLLAQHLYDVQEQALEYAKANLEDVTARLEHGVAIRFDRLRAELEVSTVKADLLSSRNELNRARTAFFRAMGVSQDSDVGLTGELTYAPLHPDREEAVEQAFLNRPELYESELDVRLQQEMKRGMAADYWPSLEAWGWHQWAKPDPHEASNIGWDEQWQAGLRLVWTLFDGLAREGRIAQQEATLRQSVIHLADTEQAILQEVRNALYDLEDADELVQSQQLNVGRANEALRLVKVGAQEGVNTELEVLDARAALTAAQGTYYEALHRHSMARLAYRRALGLLAPEPGAGRVPQEPPPVRAEDRSETTDSD